MRLGNRVCRTCPPNSYSAARWTSCVKCPAYGANCNGGAAEIQPGYDPDPVWLGKELSDFTVLHECPNSAACAGASLDLDLPAASRRLGAAANNSVHQSCTAGYTGPLCGACQSGLMQFGPACVTCWSSSASWTVVALIPLCASVGVIALTVFMVREEKSRRSRGSLGDRTVGNEGRHDTVRIMSNWFQSMLLFADVPLPLPSVGSTSIGLLSYAAQLDLMSSGPAQCVLQWSFYERFAFTGLFFAGLLVLPWLILPVVLGTGCHRLSRPDLGCCRRKTTVIPKRASSQCSSSSDEDTSMPLSSFDSDTASEYGDDNTHASRPEAVASGSVAVPPRTAVRFGDGITISPAPLSIPIDATARSWSLSDADRSRHDSQHAHASRAEEVSGHSSVVQLPQLVNGARGVYAVNVDAADDHAVDEAEQNQQELRAWLDAALGGDSSELSESDEDQGANAVPIERFDRDANGTVGSADSAQLPEPDTSGPVQPSDRVPILMADLADTAPLTSIHQSCNEQLVRGSDESIRASAFDEVFKLAAQAQAASWMSKPTSPSPAASLQHPSAHGGTCRSPSAGVPSVQWSPAAALAASPMASGHSAAHLQAPPHSSTRRVALAPHDSSSKWSSASSAITVRSSHDLGLLEDASTPRAAAGCHNPLDAAIAAAEAARPIAIPRPGQTSVKRGCSQARLPTFRARMSSTARQAARRVTLRGVIARTMIVQRLARPMNEWSFHAQTVTAFLCSILYGPVLQLAAQPLDFYGEEYGGQIILLSDVRAGSGDPFFGITVAVALLVLLLWGVGLPMVAMYAMRSRRQRMRWSAALRQLMQPYRDEMSKVWELVVTARRAILMGLAVFLPVPLRMPLAALVALVACVLHVHALPFRTVHSNLLEAMTIACICITALVVQHAIGHVAEVELLHATSVSSDRFLGIPSVAIALSFAVLANVATLLVGLGLVLIDLHSRASGVLGQVKCGGCGQRRHKPPAAAAIVPGAR